MATFIISRNGAPCRIEAVAYHGSLWDVDTHLPYLDEAALAACTPADREEIAALRNAYAPRDISGLICLARETTCARNSAADPAGRDDVQRSLKREFHAPSRLIKHPLIKATSQKIPSTIPTVIKLARGIHEFSDVEFAKMQAQPHMLERIGRPELAAIMRGDVETAPPLIPAVSPLEIAREWYGLKKIDRLRVMAELFGGEDALIEFAITRAAWKKNSVAAELRCLQGMNCPQMRRVTQPLWARRLQWQMNGAYVPEDDLMAVYPRLHETERALRENGINIASAQPGQILAAGQKVRYAKATEHAEIARIAAAVGASQEAFRRAVHVMGLASKNDLIPSIHIDGADFGLPGKKVVKIDKKDPMILFVGAYANCCGHIGGDPKKMPMTVAMVTHPDVGCYMVCDNKTGRPEAKMGVWLGKLDDAGRQNFVINAWHSSDPQLQARRSLVVALVAQEICAAMPKVDRVLIGRLGHDMGYLQTHPARLRDTALRTKDTGTQYLIYQRGSAFLPPPQAA